MVKSKKQTNYDWRETKKHLETLPDAKEKIKYLIEIKTEYKQNDEGLNWDLGTPFDKQCQLEIEKLTALQKLELQTPLPIKTRKEFKISDKQGAKTDLIRVLNALYGLRLIQNTNGTYPTKENFMKQVGEFFGVDLQKYDVNLSLTFKGTLDSNLKVFEEMKKIYTDEWEKRNK